MTLELLGMTIDLSFWEWWLNQNSDTQFDVIYIFLGWAILVIIFFWMGEELWLHHRRHKYAHHWDWVLLAVDISPIFIQTHKAIEQIFAHLSGAHVGPNLGQKYWMGKKQKFFSFEIVSIEGYIQFLVRTEAEYRDLVEAAIYAQYPEAEITEVEDYVTGFPKQFPNDTHDLFGVEFGLAESYAYPIRTYPEFEYAVSKDVSISDPMASVLENFSRIGKGESLWWQIIIEPHGSKWKEKGIDLVKKIVANKKEHHGFSILEFIGNIPMFIGKQIFIAWHWNFEEDGSGAHGAEDTPDGKVSDLTPGKRTLIESIEHKISKLGFKTKIRAIYIAAKEVYNPDHCINGLIGSLNQFHSPTSNAIVPYKITLTHYAYKKWRLGLKKNRFYNAYKKRNIKSGGNAYILNIEELTTLWHFPLPFVKTPLVQRTQAKRGEPPMNLPTELMEKRLVKKRPAVPTSTLGEPLQDTSGPIAPPPPNLPFG